MVKALKNKQESAPNQAVYDLTVSEVFKDAGDKSHLLYGVRITVDMDGGTVVTCPTIGAAEAIKEHLEWAIRKHNQNTTITYAWKKVGPSPSCSEDKAIRLMHLNPHYSIRPEQCECHACSLSGWWSAVQRRAGIADGSDIFKMTKEQEEAWARAYIEMLPTRPKLKKEIKATYAPRKVVISLADAMRCAV